MIIIDCKYFCFVANNKILCDKNHYIESIEYIDNEFDDVITREAEDYDIEYFNLKGEYHNPIGPAYQSYNTDGTLIRESYHINGKYYSYKEEFEKALNDYRNL